MSVVSLKPKRRAQVYDYSPDTGTSFKDSGFTNYVAKLAEPVLPNSRRSSQQLNDDSRATGNESGDWQQMLYAVNAELVSALISTFPADRETVCIRPVQLKQQLSFTKSEHLAQATPDQEVAEDTLVEFQWSKRRHLIRKLVREFSEQTHADY